MRRIIFHRFGSLVGSRDMRDREFINSKLEVTHGESDATDIVPIVFRVSFVIFVVAVSTAIGYFTGLFN